MRLVSFRSIVAVSAALAFSALPVALTATEGAASAKPPTFDERDGWVGPTTELSGAWDDKLQNCMSVQTSLPKDAFAGATPGERVTLRDLHAKFLTQWKHQKKVVSQGCDAAFADLPILSQCGFAVPFAAVRPTVLDDAARAFLSKYRDHGAVRFQYKYYNPETAIDDPLFEERCKAIDGKWKAVAKDSSAYVEAVKRYEAKAGSSQQPEAPMPPLEELLKPPR